MAKSPKKKLSKTPKVRADLAQNAFRVVQEATGQASKSAPPTRAKKKTGRRASPKKR